MNDFSGFFLFLVFPEFSLNKKGRISTSRLKAESNLPCSNILTKRTKTFLIKNLQHYIDSLNQRAIKNAHISN